MLVVISPHLSLMSLSEAGWPSLPIVQMHDYSGRLVLDVLCVDTQYKVVEQVGSYGTTSGHIWGC